MAAHFRAAVEGTLPDLRHELQLPEVQPTVRDPIANNPFLEEDWRHPVWRDATRRAEIEILRANASQPANFPVTIAGCARRYAERFVLPKFNAWANRGLQVLSRESDIHPYEEWLRRYAYAWLAIVEQDLVKRSPPFPAEAVLRTVRMFLSHRIEFWRAEARERVANVAKMASRPEPGAVAKELRVRRRALVRRYCEEHEITRATFAQTLAMDESALRAIIAEETKRFGDAAQRRLLKALGTSKEDWYRE